MRRRLAVLIASFLFVRGPALFADDDEGRFIVRTRSGLTDVTAACAVLGCTVERALDGPAGRVFLVAAPPGVEVEDFIGDDDCEDDDDDTGGLPGIVCAEDDLEITLRDDPSGLDVGAALESVRSRLQDPIVVDHFGTLVRRGYVEQPAVAIVELDDAREDFALVGAGTVAIIDSGVDPDHPALTSVLVPGYDFTRDLPGAASEMADLDQSTVGILNDLAAVVNPSTAALLDQSTVGLLNDPRYAGFGHGTMVAGVVRLAAPGTHLMPLKAFRADGTGFLSDIVRALYYALDRGADVVNMSFSLPSSSPELTRAAALADTQGVSLVASVGNEGQARLVYPAALPAVMGVASTTDLDVRAAFSNFGPELVWVAAPGEGVITTYPFGTWAAAWGTSFSAPLVSGAASLLHELRLRCAPGACQAARVEDAIARAEPLTPELGYGRLDMSRALDAWQLMLGLPPAAPLDSTTALKRVCEAGNHHVYLTVDVRIESGPHEDVASGCKITLGPAASFEAAQVSMAFAGPVEIHGARERSVIFTGSLWEAPSLGFYGGVSSRFRATASRLRASTGDISIVSGEAGEVELQHRLAGSAIGFDASGSISIRGSGKLVVSVAGTNLEGGTGVRIDVPGVDSALKVENAEIRSRRGPISVYGGPKALVELKEVTLASEGGATTVSLGGSESRLKTTLARISSLGGSVDLRASGAVGGVELADTTIDATYGVRVESSPGAVGRYGTVKVTRSTFSGGRRVIFQTGTLGTTEVRESSISSGVAIRILTGRGGTCQAASNTYHAPVKRICRGRP